MTTETQNALTVFPNARSFETAHVAENYPYGFRLRTKMFSWIEHTKNGARLFQQTINPKNGKLNAPKKSTYSKFLLLALNEEGHVRTLGYGDYTEAEKIESFLESYGAYMTDDEKKAAEMLIKVKRHISKAWERTEQEVKTKTYTPTEEIKPYEIIPASKLNDYAGEVNLWEISLSGNALKQRCRKESRERKELAYILRDGKLEEDKVNEILSQLHGDIQKTLAEYKSHSMKLYFDEVTFKNEGGSMFNSLSRMLFSSTKLSFPIKG